MEVQRVARTSPSKLISAEEVAKGSIQFQSVMDKRRTDMNYERLTKKVAELEVQGQKLAENSTVDNLRKYKRMIKDFMEDAVKNGLELQEQRGFNHRGSTKVYKLVKEVDKKVIELTNEVLDKEKNGSNILNLVGEIKGLLINIYT
ncbi:YaaR family protein [Peribacillus loiseleuriae]|uniref:YaaR family protein n=1 Tax=Peribacillus loiseleuriae TaxID=1679170 RepID=UPI00382D449D